MTTPASPYRSEIDALNERKTNLQRELQRLREQTDQLAGLKAQEEELAKELAGIEGRIQAGGAAKRGLPLLDQVRVASPCNAEWDEMVGDERVRFCLSCEKNVYNLSSMARVDAEALLQERLGGDVCVRFYQRADGTILTQDCPEGAKKKRRKKLALAVAGAGAMAAAAATAMFANRRMGAIEPSVAVAGGAMYVPQEMKGEVALTPPVQEPETRETGVRPLMGAPLPSPTVRVAPPRPPRTTVPAATPPRPPAKMGKPARPEF